MREALGDDRGVLTLEPCDLRPQGDPGRTLGYRPAIFLPAGRGLDAGTFATQSSDRPVRLVFSVDQLLLVVGHTRLLSGRRRFYQRVHAR